MKLELKKLLEIIIDKRNLDKTEILISLIYDKIHRQIIILKHEMYLIVISFKRMF